MPTHQYDSSAHHFHTLGIMGGTFDPIHLGHLHVADTIRSQFNLDKVVFVPSHCPPHKSITDIAPVEHRYAMVKLAIADYTYFEASRIEIDRECPTYAGDTIEEFKKKYSADWRFYFITGLDALLTILNQYRSKTYPGICHFIAAARPGYNKEDIMKKIPADFVPDVSIVEEPDLAISSTAIRQKVKAGKAIDDMVPEVVRDYILKWDLYKWI